MSALNAAREFVGYLDIKDSLSYDKSHTESELEYIDAVNISGLEGLLSNSTPAYKSIKRYGLDKGLTEKEQEDMPNAVKLFIARYTVFPWVSAMGIEGNIDSSVAWAAAIGINTAAPFIFWGLCPNLAKKGWEKLKETASPHLEAYSKYSADPAFMTYTMMY